MIHHIRKRKDKNHIIIPVDAEKALHKVQHAFMIKQNKTKQNPLSKVGIEGTHLNIIKAICDRPTAKSIFSGKKLRLFL